MDEIIESIRQNIYDSSNLIDGQEFKNQRVLLEQSKELLPYHIRQLVGYEYPHNLEKAGLLNETLKLIMDNKYNTPEDQFNELMTWIDKHPEFQKLINEEEKERIEKNIRKLEKTIRP